jgi:hypothetical protein
MRVGGGVSTTASPRFAPEHAWVSCVGRLEPLPPIAHVQQDWRKRLAKFREFIFHFGRNFGKCGSRDDPVRFKLAQLQRDHSRRSHGSDATKSVKTQFALQQMKNQHRLPNPADHRKRRLDRAARAAGLPSV